MFSGRGHRFNKTGNRRTGRNPDTLSGFLLRFRISAAPPERLRYDFRIRVAIALSSGYPDTMSGKLSGQRCPDILAELMAGFECAKDYRSRHFVVKSVGNRPKYPATMAGYLAEYSQVME